jgi:hypothetical protein
MRFTLITTFLSLLAMTTAQVLPPSTDPWYKQPLDIASYQPGDLIRSRTISNLIQPFVPVDVNVSVENVYQFLYRTTNSLGEPVAAVTTLLVPFNANPTKLLSYQIAYDSSNQDCSPSYTLQPGSAVNGLGGALSANSTISPDTAFVSFPETTD